MPLPITPAPTTTARSIFNSFSPGGPAGDATGWRCTARPPRAPTVPAVELNTNDLNLHYEDDGDPTAPPILVLHGITQSVATWGWLVPHLADAHRVVRLDLRGHGRSGRTPGAYEFPGYIAEIGRAHVSTPVTNAHLVCRLLLEKKKQNTT